MSQPGVTTLEDAALNAYTTGHSSTSDMSVFTDATGHVLTVSSSSGCTGTAYRDTDGHIIIAFQGTSTAAEVNLDSQILSGDKVSAIAGLSDALAFTAKVEAAAAAQGISTSDISVTGHSLGGTLAEYVGSQTGLGGASFAGSGVSDLVNPGASNFVSYVESGDPFANFATDAGERALVPYTSSTELDHYGTVVKIGDSQGYSAIASVVHNVQLLPFETLIGRGAAAEAVIAQQVSTDLGTYHPLSTYIADIAALPHGSPGAPVGASIVSSAVHAAALGDIAAAAARDMLTAFVSHAGVAAIRSNDQVGTGSARTGDVSIASAMHDAMASVAGHAALATLHTS